MSERDLDQLDAPRTATIPLGAQGQYETIVDADDYAFLTQWRWQYKRSRGGNVYAKRGTRLRSEGRQITILMHAVVCELEHGPRPTPQHTPHHKNYDPLDNRRENLCWATKSEQRKNQRNKRNFAIEALANYLNLREAAE